MYDRSLKFLGIAVVATGVLVSGCSPKLEHRGYLPRAKDLQQLQIGMSKTDVEALLGSPSTKATIQRNGDGYYYISSTVERRSILDPKEVERNVLAVRFDEQDNVASFAQYGLEDGRVVDINTRETISGGQEEPIIQQFLRGLRNSTTGPTPFGATGGDTGGPGGSPGGGGAPF